MKRSIFIFLAVLPLLTLSQKNFEGIISYKGYSTMDSQRFQMNISYGKLKLKVDGQKGDKHGEDPLCIIIDLEKGVQYTIDSLEETIEIDSLKYKTVDDLGAEFLPAEKTKDIVGHPARLYNAKAIIENSLAFIPENKFSIWFSEDIKYIIPEPYRNKRSLITTTDGNFIWLEFSIFVKIPIGPQKDKIDTIFVTALSTDQRPLPDSIFKLPKDFIFTHKDYRRDEETTTDIESKVDEIKKEEPQKTPPSKSSKPSKTPAKKEKETKPVKG